MIAALLATAALATTPPNVAEARPLEPAASSIAHARVQVFCAATSRDWAAFAAAHTMPAGAVAWTPAAPGPSTFLAAKVCVPLRAALLDRHVDDATLAWAIEVLTHESLHMRGMRDEGATDCEAMHEMPGVAVRFFRVKPGRRLRLLMALQWDAHRRMPAVYQTVC